MPYDIDNFFRTPAVNPKLDYRLDAMLYDRVPDHIALGYRLEGLTGAVPRHRNGMDAGPLDYDIKDLLDGYCLKTCAADLAFAAAVSPKVHN